MGDLQQTVRELDSNSKVVLKTLSQQVLPIITHHVEHDNAPVQGIHSSFSILSNQLDSMQKNIGKELSMSVVAPTRSTVSTTSGIALIHEVPNVLSTYLSTAELSSALIISQSEEASLNEREDEIMNALLRAQSSELERVADQFAEKILSWKKKRKTL